MKLTPEVRVGMIAVVTILLAVVMFIFFGGMRLTQGGYLLPVVFKQAEGLQRGADVQLSGVRVGSVEDISLTADHEALVTLRIDRTVQIRSDYQFTISQKAVIGEPVVAITPVATKSQQLPKGVHYLQAGEEVRGTSQPTIEDLLPTANDLMENVKQTSAATNRLVSDKELIHDIKETVANVDAITRALRRTLTDPALSRALEQSANNVTLASANAVQVTRDVEAVTAKLGTVNKILSNVEGLTGDSREEVKGILHNVNETTDAFRWLMQEGGVKQNIQQVTAALQASAKNIEQLTANAEKLTADQETQQNLKETVASMRRAMNNLETTSASIRDLVTDQQVHSDLKTTVQETRETVEHARNISARVDNLLERSGRSLQKLSNFQAQADFMYRYLPKDDRFFGDVGLTVYPSTRNYFRLGVYDFSESNKLDIQAGAIRSHGDVFRFGLMRGKLGVGYDWHTASRFSLSLDMIDPNNRSLNVWGTYHLDPKWGIMLGVEDMTNSNLGGLGIRFTP